jgi:hypothetical protein
VIEYSQKAPGFMNKQIILKINGGFDLIRVRVLVFDMHNTILVNNQFVFGLHEINDGMQVI